jgi:hypothetical protein
MPTKSWAFRAEPSPQSVSKQCSKSAIKAQPDQVDLHRFCGPGPRISQTPENRFGRIFA